MPAPLNNVTSYIIRCETVATSFKTTGEVISDGLLMAMILKRLPVSCKPFVVFITQSEKVMTFQNFKFAIRNYEENEKASISNTQFESVMKIQTQYENTTSRSVGKLFNKNNNNSIVCYAYGTVGH